MDSQFASINILIVTYKQEELIKRALNSILCQKEFGLNKVVICDDCSPDGTWDVIQRYKQDYPQYIDAHRNEKNLGIYGNFEKVVSLKGDADLYHLMSGDDALCDGWFQCIQLFLSHNQNVLSESAIIISDWEQVTPDGEITVFRQKIIENHKVSPATLKIRGKICIRSMMQTRSLINQHKPVDLSEGVSKAEKMFDFQPFQRAEFTYYCPFIGSIYYSGIGISTTLQSIKYRKERIKANQSFLSAYQLRPKDRFYILYRIATDEFFISPVFSRYLKKVWYYILSSDHRIGFSIKDFARVLLNKK